MSHDDLYEYHYWKKNIVLWHIIVKFPPLRRQLKKWIYLIIYEKNYINDY